MEENKLYEKLKGLLQPQTVEWGKAEWFEGYLMPVIPPESLKELEEKYETEFLAGYEDTMDRMVARDAFQFLKPLISSMLQKEYEFGSASSKLNWEYARDEQVLKIRTLEDRIKQLEAELDGKYSKAIKELRKITGGHWDKFNTNDEINKELGRDEHQ